MKGGDDSAKNKGSVLDSLSKNIVLSKFNFSKIIGISNL
jgi:hypothetical protein